MVENSSSGVSVSRRAFLLGAGALGLTSAGYAAKPPSKGTDAALTVVMSDTHIGTPRKDNPSPYQNVLFRKAVEDVLAMRPLPARVVVFGDVSSSVGTVSDYETARPLLDLFRPAGIEVSVALGNHDHRDSFAQVFPEFAARSPVKGRFVSVVDLGTSDLVMLDSLDENPKGAGSPNKVSGTLDAEQGGWLAEYVKSAARPFFVAAHHPLKELAFAGRPLANLLRGSEFCRGYLYGHNHRWHTNWSGTWNSRRLLRTACTPSTGWWGDIGFSVLRTETDRAVLENRQHDFFFPKPLKPGERRPQIWDDIVDSARGAKCVFRYA